MHPHGRAPAGTFGRGPAPSAEVPLPAPPGATSARNPTSGSKRQVTRDHPVDAAGAACSPGHILTHTGDMSETTGVTRRVLITGATGSIGSHLAEALADEYDIVSTGAPRGPRSRRRRCVWPISTTTMRCSP